MHLHCVKENLYMTLYGWLNYGPEEYNLLIRHLNRQFTRKSFKALKNTDGHH